MDDVELIGRALRAHARQLRALAVSRKMSGAALKVHRSELRHRAARCEAMALAAIEAADAGDALVIHA